MQSTQIVYRLENWDGTGIFTSMVLSAATRKHSDAANYMRGCPSPWEDRQLNSLWDRLTKEGRARNYLFVFDGLLQARDWFPERNWRSFARGLDAEGARARAYRVPAQHLHFGVWQAIVHKDHLCTPVDTMSVRELLRRATGE